MRFMIILVLALLAVLVGLPMGFLPLASGTECVGEAGFLSGIAHGFLLFWTFLAGFLYPDVGVYEVCNTGPWYNGGFVLGVVLYFGGSLWGGSD